MTFIKRLHQLVRTKQKIITLKDTDIMLTFKNQKGQGLVEYALILVLVAIVVIVILSLLGPAVGNVFSQIYRSI